RLRRQERRTSKSEPAGSQDSPGASQLLCGPVTPRAPAIGVTTTKGKCPRSSSATPYRVPAGRRSCNLRQSTSQQVNSQSPKAKSAAKTHENHLTTVNKQGTEAMSSPRASRPPHENREVPAKAAPGQHGDR